MAQLIHGTTINGHIAIHAGNLADHSLATTSYVTTQINNLIAGAPGALNTLDELAAALGDDASFASTLTNSLAGKLSLSGGTMSGKIFAVSTGTGTYDTAIELRETGYATTSQSAWGYSPAMTFHWGGRYAKRFGMRSDGLFAIDDEPIALRSWVTSQNYLTSLPSHNHDGVYVPINPDGDGPAWSYADNNPTINGKSVGGGQRFGADGDNLTGGFLQARHLNAYDGHVNSTDGYFVGSLEYGSLNSTHTTTQVIDSSGRWVGVAIADNKIASSGNWNTAYGWGNHASAGYLTSLPSHNHDDRYYTETESDGRYLYYRGMNQETDFQRFVNTPGIIRFDQANATGGFANAPGGYAYGGVLSMRGVNFGFQLWGSHTGDFYYKTQWQDDQYSGWREVITSANIGSQSVSYASQVGINYNNNSNSTYQLLWGSGNSVYGTGGVYLNPSSDYVYASSFVASDWLRTTGNTGWYSETYGGGWYMTDSSYLRPYNGKSISMGNASVDYVNQLHFNDNVRFYQDGNNQYLNFKWGNSGAGGIIFIDGDGSRQGYLYASGTGSIGILDSGGSWKVRVDTSDVEMYGTQYLTDVYANIIYDRNNSAYYVNPASTSRINSTIIYGGTSGTSPRLTFMTTDDNDTNKYIGMVSYWTQIGCHVNEGLRLVNSNGTEQFYVRGGTSGNEAWFRGNLIGASSVSSPIFYDSDNGAYYGNFAGSSRLYLLGLGGATPDAALSVSGTAHVDGTLYLGGTAGTVNSWGIRMTGTSGYWVNSSRDITFNNDGYGSTWVFNVNSAGAVKINRHIDANTGWGSASGNTIFVGWYGGKIILGNNSDSGHDYANAITAQSIVSTNRHYFYKGASLNNTVQGAEVFTVDGVNGRLFTVTDDLSDSLFSVNTIAGLPVIEAFADNTVKIGPYSAPVTFSASGISTTSHGTSANWLTAYNKRPTGVSFSGSSTKTLTLTLGDGSTLTAAFNDIDTDTNTDAQTLTLNGSTLSISGGNSVTLSSSGLSQATADTLYIRKNTWEGNSYIGTGGDIYGTIFYDSNDSAYYTNPAGRSNISTLTANGKEHYFGTSGGWDGVGFGNLTNVHMQGHSMFWFGAGNAYWWNGGINSEHDLLITTMYGYDTKSYYRGITFAVDNNGNGSSGGYRLGRWQTYGTGWNTARLQVDASLSVGYGNRIHGGSYNEGAYPLDRGVWAHGRDTAGYGDDRVRSKLFSPTANGGGPWGSFASLEVSSILDGNNDIPALFRMHQWGSGSVEFWKPQGTTLYIRESPGGSGSWFTRLEVQGSQYITSSLQAYSYQGHSNVSGTGNASYHPSGIYSTGTNWLYGTLYLNGNDMYDINGIRAYYYYDRSDTAYYVRPSGTSRLSGIYANYIGVGQDINTSYRIITSGDYYANAGGNYWAEGRFKQYRGSGTWHDVIDSGNIGSQSVNYASSAGNADTVDGYHATNAANGLATIASNGYWYAPSWINVQSAGIFASTNNAHFRPNTGSYGSWEIIGSRNGWSGIWFNDSANTLMMNGNESGHYNQNYGWQFRWYNGTFYVSTSANGGGSEYSVIHSGNIGSQSVSYASSAGSVAWSNVSSRPTALSQFSNDLGNYGGWITSSGSISGSAGSVAWSGVTSKPADWLNSAVLVQNHEPSRTAQPSGFYQDYAGSGNPTGTWFNYINVRHSNTGNGHGFQLGMSYYDSHLWYRSYQGGTEPTFATWYRAYSDYYRPYADSAGSAARATRANGNFYIDDNYGNTVVGVYSSYRLQGVFAMGDSYKLSADGTSSASHYGIAWSHPNHGGTAANLTDHGVLIQTAGVTRTAISSTIWCIGDIIAYSDAKVKANVEVIDNPLERLSKVRGVTFTRTDLEDPTKRYTGVIAQEMREALPEAVSENSNGELSVSYGNTVSLLIESIKAQQVQIEELKAEVKKLRGE